MRAFLLTVALLAATLVVGWPPASACGGGDTACVETYCYTQVHQHVETTVFTNDGHEGQCILPEVVLGG